MTVKKKDSKRDNNEMKLNLGKPTQRIQLVHMKRRLTSMLQLLYMISLDILLMSAILIRLPLTVAVSSILEIIQTEKEMAMMRLSLLKPMS